MENGPFEDVFPIENGDFPLLCLITGVYIYIYTLRDDLHLGICFEIMKTSVRE